MVPIHSAPFAVAETRTGKIIGVLLLSLSGLQIGALLLWSFGV